MTNESKDMNEAIEYSTSLEDEKVNAGGKLGRVMLVNDVNMFGRKVAIKRFSHEDLQSLGLMNSDSSSAAQKLINEAKQIAELKHPNIINIYFVGMYQNGVQVVMEYLEGETLEQRIRKRGILSAEAGALMGMQICDGLAVIHEKRIIHGNIRPENIMINTQDAPKLIGFGPIPFLISPDSGTVSGYRGYMAPERFKNRDLYDFRSDIYALGAVLYFACTGEIPLDPSPAKLPQPLADLILKAIQDEPDQRFRSAREFGEALSQVFINRRQEKIISKGEGEFECYRCQQYVPYKVFFCPFCGVEMKQVWQEKESLFRETVKIVEQFVIEGKFTEALLKIDNACENFQHQHFIHLNQEIELKKNWVNEEWNKADTKKEKLSNWLKNAETAMSRRDYEAAVSTAQEILQYKEAYYKSVLTGAQKVIDDIACIKADEQSHQDNIQRFHEKAVSYIRRGDFEAAEEEIRQIIGSINRQLYPQVMEQAEREQEWLKTEKVQADDILTNLRKRLDEAQIALETLNLDTALQLVKPLGDTEGVYFLPVVEEARRIEEEARRIINTRKEMERSLSRAIEKAAQNRFPTAFHLLDRIISNSGKAFEHQHQKALEAKEKIVLDRQVYLKHLREQYTQAIEQAEKTMMRAVTLLEPVITNQDEELADLREKARRVLKIHLIRKSLAIAGILVTLLIVFFFILKKPSVPLPSSGDQTAETLVHSEANIKPTGPNVQIFTRRANFRTGPDTTYEVAASIRRLDNYTLIAIGMKLSPDQHPWINVYIPELDKQGYVSAKLLVNQNGNTLFPTAQIISSNCRIMEIPAISGRAIGTLNSNEELTIKHWVVDENEQVWYYCETPNGKGYVPAGDVRLIPSGEFDGQQ